MVGEASAGGVGQFFGVGGQFAGLNQGIPAGQPFAESAGFPLGEVLFGDGVSGKVGLEDLPSLGQAVEPLEEAGGGLAVIDAAVELVAQFAREAGDFSVTGHR